MLFFNAKKCWFFIFGGRIFKNVEFLTFHKVFLESFCFCRVVGGGVQDFSLRNKKIKNFALNKIETLWEFLFSYFFMSRLALGEYFII